MERNIFTDQWKELVKKYNIEVLLDSLLPKLDVLYENDLIFPEKSKVFRVFKELDPDKIKVIILGQD